MKKLIVIGLGILMSLSAHGQGSKRESVEELLRAANAASLVDGIYAQMNQVVGGMGKQLGVQPDEQAIFDAYMEKIFSAMREEMSWEKIEDPMIDIYLNHYTEKEIQDMLAFYQSETGRSMVEKMPAVMKDSMQLSQKMMQEFFPKMQTITQELKSDLKEHRRQQ